MRERARHRALADIAMIRDAERASLRQDALSAANEAHAAVHARRNAEAQLRADEDAWQHQIARGAFDPDLARALASRLLGAAEAAVAAQADQRKADVAQDSADAAWRQGNARVRQAEQAIRTSRRALVRAREERELEALADRVAFRWRQA